MLLCCPLCLGYIKDRSDAVLSSNTLLIATTCVLSIQEALEYNSLPVRMLPVSVDCAVMLWSILKDYK